MTDESYQNPIISSNSNSKYQNNKSPYMFKRFLGEVLGTGALLFFPCMAATKSKDPIYVALAFGATVISLVNSVGHISGSHLNPAISFNNFLRGIMTFNEFICYMIAQISGAFLGTILLGFVKGSFKEVAVNTIGEALCNNGTADFYSLFKGALIEMILTLFLIFVINGSTDKRFSNGTNAGFVIASAIVCLVLFGGDLTGASLNPARSLSPAVISYLAGNTEGMKQLWVYIVGPLAGGILAAKAYDYLT